MSTTTFDQAYWNARWATGQTGWDLGAASTPLAAFANGLTNRDLRILIPGAGNAWEAEHLFGLGFGHTHVLDIAPEAVTRFRNRVPAFPAEQVIEGDFFAHTGRYDLVLEQTFFCALAPALRPAYVAKMHQLLEPGGLLVGLLFNCDFGQPHPPFGGTRAEYEALFATHFELLELETAANSIAPRAGNELFFRFRAKPLDHITA